MSEKKSRVDEQDMLISRKLHDFRLEKAKTQEEIGKIIGVSIQQIQKYERGANRVPASKLYTLAKEFKIDVAKFFDFRDFDYEINEISNRRRWIRMLKLFELLHDNEKKSMVELMRAIVESRERKEKEEKDESGRTE
jgi:transcriptional regulator with XRE-family HTH domain